MAEREVLPATAAARDRGAELPDGAAGAAGEQPRPGQQDRLQGAAPQDGGGQDQVNTFSIIRIMVIMATLETI